MHALPHGIFLLPFLFFVMKDVSAEQSSLGAVSQKGLLWTVPQPSALWRCPSDWTAPGGFTAAFSLRFKGRTEKHHFPRNSSLVTASETLSSDR